MVILCTKYIKLDLTERTVFTGAVHTCDELNIFLQHRELCPLKPQI